MALNFPNSPNVGDTYSKGNQTFQYTSSGKWSALTGQVQHVTTTYTALPFDYIYANSGSGAFTITLPATPTDNAMVTIVDATGSFLSKNITVDRNGSTIENAASNWTLNNSILETRFIYYSGTWNVFTSNVKKYYINEFPEISGPVVGTETSTISLNIVNYYGTSTYNQSVSAGSVSRTATVIQWTLPSVSANTDHTLQVDSTYLGYTKSSVFTVNVKNVTVVGDSSIVVVDFTDNTFNGGWDETI